MARQWAIRHGGLWVKRIDPPVEALVDGYPALPVELRSIPGWPGRVRYAGTAPA